jgi:hypothetical protein
MHRSIGMLALALVCLSVSACGDDQDAPDAERGPVVRPLVAASLAELIGPWRAEPLALDPVTADRVADGCARDMEGPPGLPVQIIDVRGGGVAMARLSGPNSSVGCHALQITAQGTVEGAGSGWSANPGEILPRLGMTEITVVERATVAGGALTVTGWSVVGEAGAGIASVTVEPAGGPVVVATVQNGWFAAWWPMRPGESVDDQRDAPALRIRGFGPLGDPVAEEIVDPGL